MYSDCLHNGQFLGIKSNNIVLYTEDECNKLNGNYYPGLRECLKKTGGSYSYDCMNYILNNLTPSITNTPTNLISQPIPPSITQPIPIDNIPLYFDDQPRNSFTTPQYTYSWLFLIISIFLIINGNNLSSSTKGIIIIPLLIPVICFMCIMCGVIYVDWGNYNPSLLNFFTPSGIILGFIWIVLIIGLYQILS
jgi:hypothetical protein